MSAGLIKHLRKKTDEDSNTRILMSQWEFDEKLVGKSLENVGSYYPHFSSHNESHSQQILVNIERLLGSNIDKLTATDTWLILEAAYWHDIGMLFNADEVQDVIENEHFKDYVEELANNNVQDLHEFAKVWHTDGWEAALVHYDNPYKGVEKYRQMVAEWYRKGHAKNSNDIVLKPFEKLNISSPRTELLPKRIYRYLGQICWSHGRNFEEVMSLLPFRQTGMGTEDCHPRFVACLLRLGDLFDIDDNRFCPVMARQVGNMPSLSETHEQKHKAIREFQLDSETVSVTAICSTEMAYIECRNWFDWIKEEIQNQMSQWKNIVPSRNFGLLPTINKLDVEMADSKVLLNNKPMKFEIDEYSAIELLQGKNLYKDKLNIYRELFQNAVDATYIRAWTENSESSNTLQIHKQSNPYDERFLEIIKKYPISMNFCKVKDEDNSDHGVWKFSISDMGSGISLKDLEYIQKIAGSNKNLERKRLINKMPIWMRPSGTFGIGLHSIFLLLEDNQSPYDRIYIKTRSLFDGSSYNIEMTSPISSNQGYCFIEQNKDNVSTKFGTTVSFYLRIKRRGMQFNSFLKHNNNDTFREIYDTQSAYDPIIKPIHDYLTIVKTISEVKEDVIRDSPLSVRVNELNNMSNIEDNQKELTWSPAYNLFFIIGSQKDTDYLLGSNFILKNRFKGQYVESLNNNFHINMFIDFYGFSARESLILDRNEWRESFKFKLQEELYFFNFIEHLLKNQLSIVKEQLDNELILSSLLHMFEIKNTKHDGQWRNLKLFSEFQTKTSSNIADKLTFADLLQLKQLTIIDSRGYGNEAYTEFSSENTSNTIITNGFNLNSYWMRNFIEDWYQESGVMVEETKNDNKHYYLTKKGNENNLIMLFAQEFLDGNSPRMTLTSEILERANLEKFSYLCCSSLAHHNILGRENRNYTEDSLLLPFAKFVDNETQYINTNELDTLVSLVHDTLIKNNPTLSKEKVMESYKDIIDIIDKKMENVIAWQAARERGKLFKPCNISILQDKFKLK